MYIIIYLITLICGAINIWLAIDSFKNNHYFWFGLHTMLLIQMIFILGGTYFS